MLGFFQKYQKFLFGFVTVMIVASFAFFGVMDTLSPNERVIQDYKVGEKLDGSSLMHSEVGVLSRFLASDWMDGGATYPNLCNDGVIRNDFLKTGLSDLIVSAYFEDFKKSLDIRLKRAKNYRGYVHPEAPFISARGVWDQIMPSIGVTLDALKEEEEVSVSTFSHLASLYAQEAICPPEFTRRALMYSHSQVPWVAADPQLHYEDLSLFGYHSLSDWFGTDFLDVTAQFILNTAVIAEEKGYQVSVEEARGDLQQNFFRAMRKLSEMNVKEDISLQEHIGSLGMSEMDAVSAWRSVLLFRRYFHGVGKSTFLDPLLFKDFAMFSREAHLVEKFEWDKALHFKTFNDLIEFQVYLDAVAKKSQTLALPTEFYPLEKVQKEAPMLVQSTYRLSVSKVRYEEIGLRASQKELTSWQLNPVNWTSLMNECSFLEHGDCSESRFQSLEGLTPANRKRVDSLARLSWAKENSHLSEEILSATPGKSQVISVSSNWTSLDGIHDPHKFGALLESASKGEDWAKTLLLSYSDHDGVIYRFDQVEKMEEAHLITFSEAKHTGVITLMTDHLLEEAYGKIRSKYPQQFQAGEEEWKLFSSVKEDVAKIVFSNLMKQVESPIHRLEAPSHTAIEALKKNRSDPAWVANGKDPFLDQFKLVKTDVAVERSAKDEWMNSEAFIMLPQEWSPVHVPLDGNITFFYFDKKVTPQDPILEQMQMGQEIIAHDAERYAAKALLERLQKQNAIHIPLQKES